jgi:tRNA threonylcarbamoyladenosine biosynthesis protein TsaE
VLHVDLYRVRGAAETGALGLRDEFRGGALVLLEWPECAGGALPVPDVQLTLQIQGDYRVADLLGSSAAGAAWIAAATALFETDIRPAI